MVENWQSVEAGIQRCGKTLRVRISVTMPDGNRKQIVRTPDPNNITEARKLRAKLKEEYNSNGAEALDGSKLKFRDLAKLYEERKLIEPEYSGTGDNRRKIRGKKSFKDGKAFLATLVAEFGNMPIRQIRHDHIEDFKFKRLDQPKRNGKPRTLASVQRELEVLRSVLRLAVSKKLLPVSPFNGGDPLISKDAENVRDRVLSFAEQQKLLEALASSGHPRVDKARAHLRQLLVFLLETAARHGETRQLERRDIDLELGVITLRAPTTKTEGKRQIPVFTDGLRQVIEQRLEVIPADPHALVFGDLDVKKSFKTACQRAGIADFRIHDCRHTAITRWITAGMSHVEAMEYSGHTNIKTFQRYLNLTKEAHQKNVQLMTAFMAQHLQPIIVESEQVN